VLILGALSLPQAARDQARDTSMRAAVRYLRADPCPA
jgi:hypothetical protein